MSLKRYFQIAQLARAQEKENPRPEWSREDTDFLPGALAITEKPAHPAGRALMWIIVLLVIISVVWSYLGKVDIVVTATGKIIPQAQIKVIKAPELGVISKIHVQPGQLVPAGAPLLSLDPTSASSDISQLAVDIMAARMAVAGANYLLAKQKNKSAVLAPPPGVDAASLAVELQRLDSQAAEYVNHLRVLDAQVEEQLAELSAARQELQRLEETYPLLQQQLDARRELEKQGLTPRLTVLELEERVISHQKGIAIQRDQVRRLEAGHIATVAEKDRYNSEFNKQVNTSLSEARSQLRQLDAQQARLARRQDLLVVRAPVTGRVNGLRVYTEGGIVQPAEQLMELVPDQSTMVAEVWIASKDVGFVRKGQPVELKFDAFPFTKYGVLPGELALVSSDSHEHERLGLVYRAEVALHLDEHASAFLVERLTSGMGLAAEVKTGRRRVIEFLLAPLFKYKAEAWRER